MIAFGAGDVVGANIHGYLNDKYGSKRSALFLMVFITLMTISTLLAI